MHADISSMLRNKTVPQWLRYQSTRNPFRLAASLPAWAGYRDRLTYRQLVQRMESVARGLYDSGLRQGSRIALFLGNRAAREAVLTALGAWQLGAMVCPLNRRYADSELQYALNLIEPDIVVVHDGADVARLRPLLDRHAVFLVLHDAAGQYSLWPEPVGTSSGSLPEDMPISCESPSCLLFTSGTTARPKAVVHNHRSQLFAGLAIGDALELTPDDTYQGAFPLFTSSALNLACMSAWVYGAGVVLEEDGLDNVARLRLIESECTSVYHGVPSVLHFMIDAFIQGSFDVRHVRRIGYGGASMPRQVIKLYQQYWPHADQVQVWGMTETGPAGAALPANMTATHAGAIGFAQRTCRIRVVKGFEQGAWQDVPAGEIGEIIFSGPSAAQGYFRDPQASAAVFVDGWVSSGDYGYMDADGVLYYVDRKKDVINRGGMKISSAAVEDVIHQHDSVLEVAVIGIAHDKLGEDVAAYVVTKPGAVLDWTELRRHCAQHLADYEVPRHWCALPELPKNAMGKVQKTVLRRPIKQ